MRLQVNIFARLCSVQPFWEELNSELFSRKKDQSGSFDFCDNCSNCLCYRRIRVCYINVERHVDIQLKISHNIASNQVENSFCEWAARATVESKQRPLEWTLDCVRNLSLKILFSETRASAVCRTLVVSSRWTVGYTKYLKSLFHFPPLPTSGHIDSLSQSSNLSLGNLSPCAYSDKWSTSKNG